jgi:hypothetical protein
MPGQGMGGMDMMWTFRKGSRNYLYAT